MEEGCNEYSMENNYNFCSGYQGVRPGPRWEAELCRVPPVKCVISKNDNRYPYWFYTATGPFLNHAGVLIVINGTRQPQISQCRVHYYRYAQ